MNYSFLPDKIKQTLKTALSGRIPALVVRASGDLTGQPGEGYIVADGDTLTLFSRKLGEAAFREIRTALDRKITDFRIEQEGGQSVLALSIGGEEFRIKGSNFELKELAPFVQRWRDLVGGGAKAATPAPGVPATAGAVASAPALTPMTGMVAALMHLAMADGKVAPEEDRYVIQVCQGKQRLLQPALAYFKSHSFEALLAELGPLLNHEQKLCVLANLMEIGMSDGTLRSSEQRLIRDFTAAAGLTEDELETIRQVLIIKNQISVMAGAS